MAARDLSARSSPLPNFFVTEALANVAGATLMILYPSAILEYITHPTLTYPVTPTTAPSPSSIQLLQWLAGLTYALSAPLLLGARNTPRAMSNRRLVYHTLAAGEACLVPIMLWQAYTSGTQPGGITSNALVIAAAVLGSVLPFRAWALFWKAEWFDNDEILAKKTR